MQRHSKISVAVLVVLISLLPGFNLGPQTFAQTNASVKILVTDAVEDLQNNNTDTALTHLSLASEQLEIPSDGATTSAVSLNNRKAERECNNNCR